MEARRLFKAYVRHVLNQVGVFPGEYSRGEMGKSEGLCKTVTSGLES